MTGLLRTIILQNVEFSLLAFSPLICPSPTLPAPPLPNPAPPLPNPPQPMLLNSPLQSYLRTM